MVNEIKMIKVRESTRKKLKRMVKSQGLDSYDTLISRLITKQSIPRRYVPLTK